MTTETETKQSLPIDETASDENDNSSADSSESDVDSLIKFAKDELTEALNSKNEEKKDICLSHAIYYCNNALNKVETREKGPKKSIKKDKVAKKECAKPKAEYPTTSGAESVAVCVQFQENTKSEEKPKQKSDAERDALRREWAGMND